MHFFGALRVLEQDNRSCFCGGVNYCKWLPLIELSPTNAEQAIIMLFILVQDDNEYCHNTGISQEHLSL